MKRSLRSWLWGVPVEQEVDEELQFHIDMRARELIAQGMDPEGARATAIRRLGDVARLRRTCIDVGRKRDREMRLTRWFEEFGADVRFSIRQLKAAPAFTLVAVITLALGIGANSAIFALVDAALLRPLPFPEPERIVAAWERGDTFLRGRASPLNFLDWSERNRTFETMAAFVGAGGGMVMAGADGTAETVSRQWVTAGIFDVLDLKPIAGRTFLAADDASRSNVVVLTEGFWRARFGGDSTVIGRDIRLDGQVYTVIGVVPMEAQLLGRSNIWAMIPMSGPRPTNPNARRQQFLQVIGRLKPGVTLEAAGAEMTAIGAGLAQEFPDTNKGRSVMLEPMRDALIGWELRLTSMLFVVVVGFVLLMCCANVANLLLARATVRARELAVRSALGAGRRRILRQLLTESFVLAVLGGLMGAGLGAAILSVAPAVIPEGLLPGAVTLTFDGRVIAFCAAAALLVGVLFGLVPVWQAGDRSLIQAIDSGGRTVSTRRGGRFRTMLVVGEVATAVLLLCGAGLLLRTLMAVGSVDRGYRAEHVLTMMVDPLGGRYPTQESLRQFYDAVEQEVLSVPGVRSAAWAITLPLGGSEAGSFTFEIVGDPAVDESKRPSANYQIVSPTYFQTLDLPVVTGRAFTDRDTSGAVPVCIVNEAFVRTHLQGRDPIGMRIAIRPMTFTPEQPVEREIVGVARQVKGRADETEALVQIYVPTTQNVWDDMYLLVRPIAGRAEALVPAIRAAIGRVDREQLVSVRDIMTLEDVAWGASGRHRFRAVMVMTFAALALLLAMIGVFGVLGYSVQQRRREFGVRIALGASPRDVLSLVAGSAARVITVGAVIGLLLAALLGQSISAFLFGVQPLDPVTFVGVALALALTAAIATAAPALRATRVDPVVALRND